MLDKKIIKDIENKARATEPTINTEHRIVKRMVARLEAITELVPEAKTDAAKAREILFENFYADAKYQPTWEEPLKALNQNELNDMFKGKLAVGQKRGRAAAKEKQAQADTAAQTPATTPAPTPAPTPDPAQTQAPTTTP